VLHALPITLFLIWSPEQYLVRSKVKVKVIPQQAEVAQGVPGRLRPQIFLTFGTTRVVGRQPYAPAAFTPGEIPGTHFQGLSRPQGTWFRRGEPRKKSPVTPSGIVPGTVRRYPRPLVRNTDKKKPSLYVVFSKSPFTSTHLDSNIFLWVLLSDTLRLFLPPCRSFISLQKTGKILVLWNSIFLFLHSKLEDKRFFTEW
jgi:hypothetical protein